MFTNFAKPERRHCIVGKVINRMHEVQIYSGVKEQLKLAV